MTETEDWKVVGHVKGPLGLGLSFKEFEDEAPFEEFTEAMKRLSSATQTVTIAVDGLTIQWLKLLTGWDFSWRLGPDPMPPGLVTWDGRRRRKRRKP